MRTRLMRTATAAVLAGGLSLGLAACDDTVEGLEQDTEENIDELEENVDDGSTDADASVDGDAGAGTGTAGG